MRLRFYYHSLSTVLKAVKALENLPKTSHVQHMTTSKLFIIFSLACLFPGSLTIHAQEPTSFYTIQIGAYLYPPANLLNSTEKFGQVFTRQTGGLTRISVGSFNNRNDAQRLLSEIQQFDHPDAFIALITLQPTSTKQSSGETISEMEKFRLLSDAEKAKAIFYNGKLHLKENNQFTPVP